MRKEKLVKVFFGTLLVTATLLFLMSCGNDVGRYENATARNRAIGEQAVGIVDEFLDRRIDARTANSRIADLGDIDHNTDNNADLFLGNTIVILRSRLTNYQSAQVLQSENISERFEAVLETRNRLAVGLGMDER